jgi:hypothetical protein
MYAHMCPRALCAYTRARNDFDILWILSITISNDNTTHIACHLPIALSAHIHFSTHSNSNALLFLLNLLPFTISASELKQRVKLIQSSTRFYLLLRTFNFSALSRFSALSSFNALAIQLNTFLNLLSSQILYSISQNRNRFATIGPLHRQRYGREHMPQ